MEEQQRVQRAGKKASEEGRGNLSKVNSAEEKPGRESAESLLCPVLVLSR